MKVAVLSDIHGNMPALQSVTAHIEAWRPDVVVVNGDVVNRGPLSKRCWDFVQTKMHDKGWLITQGNHEEYVLGWTAPADYEPLEFEIYRSSYWTYHQFEGKVQGLIDAPMFVSLATVGGELRFTHASMRGNRDGVYKKTTDAELREKIGKPPAVFFTGHTHRPHIRQVDGTLVVNTGAAGTCFDGDTRASYAQAELVGSKWQAKIIRLDYDRDQMMRDYDTTGYLKGSGELTRIFYEEWKWALSLVPSWRRQYHAAVMVGEIGLAESVDRFLVERLGAV